MDGGLVEVQLRGVVDGTVVVDLAPMVIEQAKDARGAEDEIADGGKGFETAALAAHGEERFAGDVQRIAVELHGDACGAGEKMFIDAADFRPAAFDAADRIIHGNFFKGRPVLSHENDVASIECTIKLRKSMTRMSEITEIFVTGDGIERGGKSG